jgi:hypothetical protein
MPVDGKGGDSCLYIVKSVGGAHALENTMKSEEKTIKYKKF